MRVIAITEPRRGGQFDPAVPRVSARVADTHAPLDPCWYERSWVHGWERPQSAGTAPNVAVALNPSHVKGLTYAREGGRCMLTFDMSERSWRMDLTEAARPDSAPALVASSRHSAPRRCWTEGVTCSVAELERRPIPPERGLRRFCVVGGVRAHKRGLWQQMCRGLIHGCDTLWRAQHYPLSAPQSNRGVAAVGSRRASTCERVGLLEQQAPGTCRGSETIGLTDQQRGGRGLVSRAALSDRHGHGRTPARSGLRCPGRSPVLPGGRPGVVQANANRGGWR